MTTKLQIGVREIEFCEDGSTVVTFAASGGGLTDKLRFSDTVTQEELSKENIANERAGKAVDKAKRRLGDTFFKLYSDVDTEMANQNNESGTEVDVRRRVRLVSMKRGDNGAVTAKFDVNNGAMTFDVAVEKLSATLGLSQMPTEVHPDRVVVSARTTLAKLLMSMSGELRDGQIRI